MASSTLQHVHETVESVATVELTPPHPPRTETPAYARAHHFLVYEKKAGCAICGVNVETLDDATVNIYGAKAIETHHFPVERSLVDACDPLKVHADFPQVYDRATLLAWVDSPANLLTLCDIHHRHPEHGIHHLLPQDWQIQKYLLADYQIAAKASDASSVLVHDEQIEQPVERILNLALDLASASVPAASAVAVVPTITPSPALAASASSDASRSAPAASADVQAGGAASTLSTRSTSTQPRATRNKKSSSTHNTTHNKRGRGKTGKTRNTKAGKRR